MRFFAPLLLLLPLSLSAALAPKVSDENNGEAPAFKLKLLTDGTDGLRGFLETLVECQTATLKRIEVCCHPTNVVSTRRLYSKDERQFTGADCQVLLPAFSVLLLEAARLQPRPTSSVCKPM